MNTKEAIVFDRYTEKNLSGGWILFDITKPRECHIRINRMATRMMNLCAGMNMQFIKIGDQWFLHPTKLKRGYNLSPNKSGLEYRIHAKRFILEFISELRYSEKVMRFKIKKTKVEYEGGDLFLIDHSKSMKEKI